MLSGIESFSTPFLQAYELESHVLPEELDGPGVHLSRCDAGWKYRVAHTEKHKNVLGEVA